MSGYVVREKTDGDVGWATAADDGSYTDSFRERAQVFDSIRTAARAWAELLPMVDEARIFSVSDDGTETPLPTYEEALAALAELRAKVATLRETADACEDARSLYDAIVDFCAEVSK